MDDSECLRRIRELCLAYAYSVTFSPGESPVMCRLTAPSKKHWFGYGDTATAAFAMACGQHDAEQVKSEEK